MLSIIISFQQEYKNKNSLKIFCDYINVVLCFLQPHHRVY